MGGGKGRDGWASFSFLWWAWEDGEEECLVSENPFFSFFRLESHFVVCRSGERESGGERGRAVLLTTNKCFFQSSSIRPSKQKKHGKGTTIPPPPAQPPNTKKEKVEQEDRAAAQKKETRSKARRRCPLGWVLPRLCRSCFLRCWHSCVSPCARVGGWVWWAWCLPAPLCHSSPLSLLYVKPCVCVCVCV